MFEAKQIFGTLRGAAPDLLLLDIVEAVLGVRAARLQVREKSLPLLRRLASTADSGLGLAEADFGLLVPPTPHLGGWSDGFGRPIDRGHPDAVVNVYLAKTTARALDAKFAEESLGDDAFGEILGIPGCCRDFYLDAVSHSDTLGDSLHWASVAASKQLGAVPTGAVFLGRYYGRSLVSHFPCSLECLATRRNSKRLRHALRLVDQEFADGLAATHGWSYLVVPGKGMIAFDSAEPRAGGSFVELGSGAHLGWEGEDLASYRNIQIEPDRLVLTKGEGSTTEYAPSEARFITPSGEW